MQRGQFQSYSLVGIWKPTQYWWCHELQLSHSIQENTSESTSGSSLKHMHVNHSSSVVIFCSFFPPKHEGLSKLLLHFTLSANKRIKINSRERIIIYILSLVFTLSPSIFFPGFICLFSPFPLFC